MLFQRFAYIAQRMSLLHNRPGSRFCEKEDKPIHARDSPLWNYFPY